MIRKMTCIVCPNGCELEAEIVDGKCISVSGNLCPKGAQYAAQEVEAPKRTIHDCKLRGCERRSSPTCQRAVKSCSAEGEAV